MEASLPGKAFSRPCPDCMIPFAALTIASDLRLFGLCLHFAHNLTMKNVRSTRYTIANLIGQASRPLSQNPVFEYLLMVYYPMSSLSWFMPRPSSGLAAKI
jgi:hypothetical protein